MLSYFTSNKNLISIHLHEFRKEPAILKFDWPFTPNHKSSPSYATDVSSVLRLSFK